MPALSAPQFTRPRRRAIYSPITAGALGTDFSATPDASRMVALVTPHPQTKPSTTEASGTHDTDHVAVHNQVFHKDSVSQDAAKNEADHATLRYADALIGPGAGRLPAPRCAHVFPHPPPPYDTWESACCAPP